MDSRRLIRGTVAIIAGYSSLIGTALATSPTERSMEQRRPAMMLFSDLNGEKAFAYLVEKHWDNQYISTSSSVRTGRYGSFATGTPEVYWSISKNVHMGAQVQWYLFDIALILNAQYDFLRTQSGKLSASLMYKGSWLLARPGLGAQLAFHQLLFGSKSNGAFALDAAFGINGRYVDHRFTEVETQGTAFPQASFIDYVGTSSVFGAVTAAWRSVVLRTTLSAARFAG